MNSFCDSSKYENFKDRSKVVLNMFLKKSNKRIHMNIDPNNLFILQKTLEKDASDLDVKPLKQSTDDKISYHLGVNTFKSLSRANTLAKIAFVVNWNPKRSFLGYFLP